jgi:hypothetical protein
VIDLPMLTLDRDEDASAEPRSDTPSRFPCMDIRNQYTRCIGRNACVALGTKRCWDGSLLTVGPLVNVSAAPRMEESPRRQYQRSATNCATCANTIEVKEAARPQLPRVRYADNRLFACTRGMWTGLCSMYNLNNHRAPLKDAALGGCPEYVPVPEDQLRPELIQQWNAHRERARTRRQLIQEARTKADCQRWGETMQFVYFAVESVREDSDA